MVSLISTMVIDASRKLELILVTITQVTVSGKRNRSIHPDHRKFTAPERSSQL